MNSTPPLPPSDDELEHLLSARLRRTSPEFEQRWRDLRHTFADPAPLRRRRWSGWLMWPGFAAAVIAGWILATNLRHAHSPARYPDTVFEQLIALDAALRPAEPLLDAENRQAVLHLAVSPTEVAPTRVRAR